MITAKTKFKNYMKENDIMPSLEVWMDNWGYSEKYYYEVKRQVVKEIEKEAISK